MSQENQVFKLYGNFKSGNVYKVSLALHMLKKEYQEVQVGLGPNSSSQSAEYKAINPLGQIPVLEVESGKFISQSNAILWYLAQDSDLLPADHYQQAVAMQWMCFEQYELEPNLAWSRWICHLMNQANERAEDLQKYHAGGYRALRFVEQQLAKTAFITGDKLSIADICLFAYIHNCHQGQFSLAEYPLITAWLEKVKAQPNFFPMEKQFEQFDYA